MSLRWIVTLAAVVVVGAGGFAFAATLTESSKSLAAGQTTVPACDIDGFSYTRTLNASHQITSVTLSGIAAACAGGTLQLVLADSSNASVGAASGTVPAGGGTLTLTVSPTPTASTVNAYRVAITN